jgi:hypothetical protein
VREFSAHVQCCLLLICLAAARYSSTAVAVFFVLYAGCIASLSFPFFFLRLSWCRRSDPPLFPAQVSFLCPCLVLALISRSEQVRSEDCLRARFYFIFSFGLCWILPCHRDSFPAHLILVLWHIRSQVCSCCCFSSKQVLLFLISLQLWFVLSLERSSGCSCWKILDPFPTRISSLRDSVLCADKLFALPCHGLGFHKACCSICRPDSFFSAVLFARLLPLLHVSLRSVSPESFSRSRSLACAPPGIMFLADRFSAA